jgi:hypothetical protein
MMLREMMPRYHHRWQVAMPTSFKLIVADNMSPPNGAPAPAGNPRGAGYEPGHSERQVTGSVVVGQETQWMATLAVPMTGDQSALLTLEREGPSAPDAPCVEQVMLVIPPGEEEAVLALLRGIVDHARENRVLVGGEHP